MSETEVTIPSTVAIAAPNAVELVTASTKLLDDARAIVIDSNDMFEIAADELAAIKTKTKELDEKRDSLVRPLNGVVKAINDLFRAPLAKLAEGEKIIKDAMLTWTTEQERLARIERERLQREADERRLAADKEAREAREQLEQAAESGTDADIEAAQALVAEAEEQACVVAAPIHYVAAAPRAAGTSVRKVWKARLPEAQADKLKALAYIIANPQYLHLVEFSQSECNKLASAMKQHFPVEGIAAYQDSGIAARAR